MGRPDGPQFGEARLTEYLEETLLELGLVVQRQPVSPGRENLVARLDGGARVILLDAHQDTVPVEGMTIEPFHPTIRDGRLYGRGACDTKGGMAAMLAAVARLARERPPGMPTVVLGFTVNEEYGFTGATALRRLWTDAPSAIVPRKPDVAVVAEPTDLDVVVAHKGVVRWKCHTAGRACHSARPEDGENAIYRMARVVEAAGRYACELRDRSATHPLCGGATVSVGTIRGGASVNTVPDACTIEIDSRMPPGERPEQARDALIDYVAGIVGPDVAVRHDPPYMLGPAMSDDGNGPLAELVLGVTGEVAGEHRQRGVPYATNAALYAATGVPSVVFGPGCIEQAHTADEWISLDQVHQAAEIFYRLILNAT
ncbi:MAG: M20 family metallopeptidase [Candidatus Nealsonbacteria bacterium]|nr:M20 family metallopeptidase [Candidatus Nealsonbacteria bacterium]